MLCHKPLRSKHPNRDAPAVTYQLDLHHRRSIHLPHYDYASPGPYFLTICTHMREPLLVTEDVRAICVASWRFLLRLPADPEAWDFVVMPNHVHGVA